MRSGAGSATTTAAADADGRSTTAATSGSGCPRLIDGAIRRKGPILEDRAYDLTAIERGTGKVRERVSQVRPRYLPRLHLSGGNAGRYSRSYLTMRRMRPHSPGCTA